MSSKLSVSVALAIVISLSAGCEGQSFSEPIHIEMRRFEPIQIAIPEGIDDDSFVFESEKIYGEGSLGLTVYRAEGGGRVYYIDGGGPFGVWGRFRALLKASYGHTEIVVQEYIIEIERR